MSYVHNEQDVCCHGDCNQGRNCPARIQYTDDQIDAWDFIADLSFAAKVVGAVLALGFVLALSGGWLYISWPQMVAALSI